MNLDEKRADPSLEAERLIALANAANISVRLLGGVAISLLYKGQLPPALQREYKDLDFVCTRDHARRWSEVLESNGYKSDVQFNSIHGSQRLLHFNNSTGGQLDTFVEEFSMCQQLELKTRLGILESTLTPIDLLLTKLQIFEINDKDLVDAIALFLKYAPGDSPTNSLEKERVKSIVGSHWGWYTTLIDNLEKVKQRVFLTALSNFQKEVAIENIDGLLQLIVDCPKSIKWKTRAKVGRRMPWYDLPEEVEF